MELQHRLGPKTEQQAPMHTCPVRHPQLANASQQSALLASPCKTHRPLSLTWKYGMVCCILPPHSL
eukprot:60151-Pelagomonas_calceolata.AAC.2